MKNLFLVDGASGTGKTDLLRYISDFHVDCLNVPKLTTREKRPYETDDEPPLDLTWVTEDEFDRQNPDYQYKYDRKRYGFTKQSLDDALRSSDNVFLIVRHATIIERLIGDYAYINVVPIYIYTDNDLVVARLRGIGVPEDQIKFRLGRLIKAFEDYIKHPGLYKEIMINNSTVTDFSRLIDSLLGKYSHSPQVEDDLVFVLMSFSSDDPALPDYYAAMKRSVAAANPRFRCSRLDEVRGSYAISTTAKRKIQECRLAIVDLTGTRPNVYYELGFAHALRKQCLLTAHKDTPPQVYPNEYNLLYYGNATELEQRLTHQLRELLGNA